MLTRAMTSGPWTQEIQFSFFFDITTSGLKKNIISAAAYDCFKDFRYGQATQSRLLELSAETRH